MRKELSHDALDLVWKATKVGVFAGLVVYGSLWTRSFSPRVRDQVINDQNGQCADCGIKPEDLQVHHIVPYSKGGKQTRENAVGMCPRCHNIWDKRAHFEGIIYPGIPMGKASNQQRFRRGKRK
ncbi:MAG TPA: HNH endonuclease signature motif containing protein [Candidatus Woesebacteria bacterium]|jgi:hypothetical protein|nr:HNH endonuclease signature motif containing protein [Candidatus Woesebacteria bacterium]HNS94386.1 HNH endonuclease signature motif containing protein [Candidatus Woesebacteria bacterium]